MDPSFSIVIPTYQRKELVCDVVRRVCAIEYSGQFEVIVVVDGSTDGTAAALANIDCPLPLLVVEQENRGAAAARNRGAAESVADIIMFIDDDMLCEADILQQHARMYHQGADAVTGDVFIDESSPHSFITDSVRRWIGLPRPIVPQLPFQVYTGQLSVRRAVFQAAGGFDETFTSNGIFGHEDSVLGVKLVADYDLRHNPDAVTRQRYVVGPRETMQRAVGAAAADVRFLTSYPQFTAYLLDQRGRFHWKSLLIYQPLCKIPFVPQMMRRSAVWIAEAAMKTRWRSARILSHFFYTARAVTYWSAVRKLGGFPRSHSLLILCYHAIRDQSSDPVLAPYGVPPESFSKQLESLIRREFVFVGPDAFDAFLNKGAPLPRRAVLLTFDDCYSGLVEIARDMLRPRGIGAIAFAVTGLRTNEWDQADGAEELRLLTAEELVQLRSLGVEIGAHSRTHQLMPRLRAREQEAEAGGSREDLVASGLPPPRFFAFPYGASNPQSVAIVRAAGYSAAFEVSTRRVDRTSDPFRLPRVPVLSSDDGWRFRLKTASPKLFDWLDLNLCRASRVLRRAAFARLA